MAAGSGRKTHFGCRLPGVGVPGAGLRFKVTAPNVDTSSISWPGFSSLLQQQAEMTAEGVD